jgi:hypothetical protein
MVGFIAGVTAPAGKRMGHAGALISGGADTADAKLAIMEECGFKVTRNPSEMAKLLKASCKAWSVTWVGRERGTKSSSAKNAQFWRSDWFAGVLVVVAVVILLNQATDFIGTMERKFYDFASTSSARQPSDRVAVIAIDDQSIANIGRWPWPRDVHAKLIDQLAEPRPRPSSTPHSSSSPRSTAA